MNPTIELLKNHRSIRKFKKKEVEKDKLDLILETATKASTSGNMQAYSIIVTKDQQMKKRMFEAHFEQPMLLEAPVFLTFCADFNRMRKWLIQNNAKMNFDNFMSFMIASLDAVLASQVAAVAAESLGLGLCYMGTTLASAYQLGEILECPKNVIPVAGYVLGYPDESPDARLRLPIEAIIHQEKYRDYNETEICEIHRQKNEEGMARFNHHPDLGDIDNLARVYSELKYTRESHLKYSNDLLGYLSRQNFMENA
jgi:nitroreductase